MKVFKYIIMVDAHEDGFWVTDIEMPMGSEVISCGAKGFGLSRMGEVLIWAIVPDVARIVRRQFGVLGTGVSVISSDELGEGKFLGTVVNGPAVWHVFDLGEVRE